MPPGRDLKQFNVYLPPDLIRALKHYAVDTEQSLSAVAEAALSAYLKAHTARRREWKNGN